MDAAGGLQLDVDMLKVKGTKPSLLTYTVKLFVEPGVNNPHSSVLTLLVEFSSQYTPMPIALKAPTLGIVILV